MSANAVQKLYVAYFNRPADTLGLNYWVSVVAANGGSTALVSAAFASSAEYAATYAGLSTAARVDAIYNNLFGRSAEPAGLTYWGQLIESGRISISNAVTQIANGAQGTDLTAYNNKVKGAEAFTAALDTTAEIVAYSGTAANNAAKAWMTGITTDATLTAATTTAALNASVAKVVTPVAPVVPVVPVATFDVTGSAASVNEGSSVVFTLQTTNVAAGSSYSYVLSGVSAADVAGGSLTGTVTIGADGKALIPVTLVADATTEGAETLTVTVAGKTASATVTDTSTTPAPTPLNIPLTANQDVGAGFTGGDANDVFNALATTLTTGDNLAGGLGSDTLSLSATIAANTAIAGFTLNSVENVSVALSDGDATTAHALTLNMLNAGAVNASVSGAAATTRADGLTLNNLAVGSSVGLSNSTNLNLTANFVAAATAGTADAVSLALNTAASTAGTDGIVTIGAGFETLNISTSGSASVVDDIVFGGTVINVTGDQNLTVRAGLDDTLTTINASTYTGRLNITSTTDGTTPDALVGTVDVADLTITGGTGNDTFNLTANAAVDELNVNAGAGDDTVTIGNVLANASSTNVGDVLNGGDGTDTLTADVDLIDAAAITTALTGVSSFETLNLSGTFDDASVVNVANISSALNRVNISTVSGALNHTINYAAGAQTLGLNVAAAVAAGQSLTLDAAGSATTDSLAIVNMLAATGTAQALSATSDLIVTDFETVSINTGSYTTPTAQLVNVVNIGANTLTLSGSNGLTTTATNGIITATTINASAMTGALVMGAAAASVTTITGGSAADTLLGDASSTINGGGGNDTITGGTGNDTLNGDDGNDTITTGTGTDTVNGGAGNDTIVVGANLSALDTINGGDGSDTLSATTASLAVLAGLTISDANAFNTRFTSVETLRLTDALDQTTFDLGYLNSLTGVRLDAGINGAETLNGFDSNETLDLRAALSAVLTVGVNSATAGASDVFNVAINSAAAGVDFTDLSIANVETLNIAVNEATASATVQAHTIGLTLSQTTVANSGSGAAQTVNISGTESLTIDTAIAAGTINASGMTVVAATDAGLTMGAAFTATTAITGQTITGSDKVDVLLGSTGNDTINAGAGNDTISGGAGADIIDGGTGTNTFVAVANGTTNVEGAGTGTVEGVAINLGTTAVTAAAINTALGTTIGLSGASSSLAAGTAQYTFGTQSNFFATTADTLTNIQNVTGTAGADYIVGSAAANVITGGAGADTLTGGAGADTFNYAVALVNATQANVDSITSNDFGTTDILRFTDLTLTDLRGNGSVYTEASGVVALTTSANLGFFLATNVAAGFTEAQIYTALAEVAADLANGDIFYAAISNGTDSVIVRITDVANAGLVAADDTMEFVVTLLGIDATELAALGAANFSNFT